MPPAVPHQADRTYQLADGYVDIMRRLGALGVTITRTPLPTADAASWCRTTRTLHLAPDLSMTDQLAVMNDLWMRAVAGPSASRAQARPWLTLLPSS